MVDRNSLIRLATCSLGFAVVVGCSDDDKGNPAGSGGSSNVDVPAAYVFDSRFNAGESSVSYSGQVVRQLLLQDLKSVIDGLAKDGAEAIEEQELLNLYDYDDGLDLETRTTAGDMDVLENRYSSISTGKNLSGKVSDEVVIGYGKTADTLVREWFAIIADNSKAASKLGTAAVYTTDDGVDLTQMINKVLIGAVAYSQATDNYLGGLLEDDNEAARSDGSTSMEHHWDEAFGYFGAARDYSRYSDDDLAGKGSGFVFDSNGDGKIDFRSEYNFGLSRNAGKRDRGGTGVDFTGETFTAFLTGRALISNGGSTTEIAAQRQAAANGMEKVIAATVIHYINDTLADMADLGTADENIPNLNKHWAEMKGFTVALQYSPDDLSIILESDIEELHGLMGEAPVHTNSDATRQDYDRAKDILQGVYGFSSGNMAIW